MPDFQVSKYAALCLVLPVRGATVGFQPVPYSTPPVVITYLEGRAAREEGRSQVYNPYWGDDAIQWNLGWTDEDREKRL